LLFYADCINIVDSEEEMSKQPIEDQTAELRAASKDAAIARIEKKVAGKLVVVGTEVLEKGTSRDVTVDAFDTKEAKAKAKDLLESGERISSVKETQEAKRGFLGIGKAAGVFKVRIRRLPLIRVIYKVQAKRCEYYKNRDFGEGPYYVCTAGGPGSPDPTAILGWDIELCRSKGGKGCFHKKVMRSFGRGF